MSSNGWLLKKFHFCARNLIDILLNSVESFFFQLCTHSTQPLKFRKWCKIILKGKTISDTQVRDVTHPRASRIFIFIVSSTNRKSRARTKESLDEDFSKEIHNYIYFWKINSVFSQWFPCTFVVDGITYNSAIQYMMHQKAGKSHLNIAHIFRPDHIIKKKCYWWALVMDFFCLKGWIIHCSDFCQNICKLRLCVSFYVFKDVL